MTNNRHPNRVRRISEGNYWSEVRTLNTSERPPQPIEPVEIHRIYRSLAEEIADQETALIEELPVDETAGLDAHLNQVIRDWETGHKTVRTVPAVAVYRCVLDEPVADSVMEFLVGLDILINVLDDIIDTAELSTADRIRLTCNAAFATTLVPALGANCPPDVIRTLLRQYLTELFQIPLVERRLIDQFRNAGSPDERLRASRELYAYRSRDINVFAELPAVVHDVETTTVDQISTDLRRFRARAQLFKDARDIERDRRDDDVTPLLWLLDQGRECEVLARFVADLHAEFAYSEAGWEMYGPALVHLEQRPDQLERLLAEQQLTNKREKTDGSAND